ncbi:MAG TPA: MMPL family transporter [Polyangia bacterium]|nr:MMPL family transporter [Polyangia bacterium]
MAAVAGFLAWHLNLRTSFAELLPSGDPGVIALTKTQNRIGDLSLLLIGIKSPDRAANERYAELLTEKLRAMPGHVVSLATYHLRDVRAFFDKNKWLYVSEENLETIRDRLRTEINKRKNPLFVSLGEDEPIESMQKRIGTRDKLEERFPGGLFTNKSGDYLWIAALPPGGLFVEHAGEGLFRAANDLIKQNPPERFHPAMRAEVAGPVATAVAARKAVEDDIKAVTLTCLILVAASIGLYFRQWRSIPLTGVPAVFGALVAFAVAELAFGYLNSSTAFLGSIILGNGINYAIVLMSRYEEERAHGGPPARALRAALAGTWRGTLVAAISASAAYASLTVTSFRGFYQFGVMGAVGAIACWVGTFTLLPALLALLDGRRHATPPRARAPLDLGWLARGIQRRSTPLVVGLTALSITAVFGLRHFLSDPFEYDFRKLNAKLNTTEEARGFNDSIESLFGRWPSPTIVLADALEEVELIRATIRKQDAQLPGGDVIGQITTVYDLLPGPPDVQQRKLEFIKQIRKLVHDPALEVLNADERKQIAQIDPADDLHELRPADLPLLARRPFTEIDGTIGRVVLVYPVEVGLSVWNGKDLLRIAAVLQYLHLPNGKVIETSGSAVVFGSMIRSILHDGPIATAASLIAVLIIVAFTIRPARAALLALGTLALGVIWMMGSAGWGGVRVTFLNFIALPITFGIGAEYALNVLTRYREDRNIVHAVLSTGAAVALCSWTTIVGYGSLLAARNRALNGFGWMAILGEIACLLAAIVAMPALILAMRQRRTPAPPALKVTEDGP